MFASTFFANMQNDVIALPLRVTKNPSTINYEIERGNQVNVDVTEKEKSLYSNSMGRNFHGHCYNCGCMKHSKNYCPLKLCSICCKYGHDQRVCFFNTAKKLHNHYHYELSELVPPQSKNNGHDKISSK